MQLCDHQGISAVPGTSALAESVAAGCRNTGWIFSNGVLYIERAKAAVFGCHGVKKSHARCFGIIPGAITGVVDCVKLRPQSIGHIIKKIHLPEGDVIAAFEHRKNLSVLQGVAHDNGGLSLPLKI